MKRQPAPSTEDIGKAIDEALRGKGAKLARIIKSFSADDLAKGFAAVHCHSGGMFRHCDLKALDLVLANAAGRKEERAHWTEIKRSRKPSANYKRLEHRL